MSQEIIQGYRLSPQQKRLWLLHQSDPSQPYRVRAAVEIEGELDANLLQSALQRLITQHEILRTFFQLLPGMTIPVQVIADEGVSLLIRDDFSHLSPDEQAAQVAELFDRVDSRVDYTQLPLLRAELARLSEKRNLLVISTPLLCADGASLQILMRQIAGAYASLKNGEEPARSTAMQYADFAEWQNELLESSEAAAAHRQTDFAADFARRRLAFERPRTSEPRQKSALSVEIASSLAGRLMEVAGAFEVPLSTLMLACWETLLWRSTGWEDLRMGLSFAGRQFPELEETIGPIESYVSISTQLNDGLPFNDLLRQLGEQQQEAERLPQYFASYSGEQVEPSAALLPFLFEWRNEPLPFHAGGLTFSFTKLDTGGESFKLKIVGRQSEDVLKVELQYDAGLFAADDIQRLAQRFETLIADVVNAPGATLGDLDVLSVTERHLLLHDFNDTAKHFPGGECVHEMFAAQAQQHPDAVAVIFESEQLSFAELNARANQLAHRLQKLGVGADAPVGLCFERSLELIVGLLGILKAGGAYVPIDPDLPTERCNIMLADSAARVLVTRSSLAAGLSDDSLQVVCLDTDKKQLANESAADPDSDATDGNLAYIIFTSGSTGRPKGVAVEHRQLRNYVHAISEQLNLPVGSSFAMISTIAADLGNTVLFPSLLRGGTLHLISEERATNPDALVEYCRRHPIDCLKIVPSHLSALLSAARPADLLPRRQLVLGGEACTWTLAEKVSSLAPACRLLNHYGPTEATVGATTYRVDFGAREQTAEIVPLGVPLANSRAYILDQRMRPAPIGTAGELHLGGAGVARGYAGRAEATAEKFIPDPYSLEVGSRCYKTGDLARYLPDGHIEFLGRIDDQVKIHGFRIEPAEIEQVLRDHPSVATTVVLAREDQPGEKRLIAYVVAREGRTIETGDLKTFLQGRLPEYMMPKAIVLLASLPLTGNGKVDRHALPAPDLTRSGKAGPVAPRNQAEATLVQIWSNVLGVSPIGIDDNFFELGGDSILSIQIIARANQAGLRLSPRQVFQHQTIAALAAVAGTTETPVADQGVVTGAVPMTPVQARFFAQEQPEPHHYNQAMLLKVDESLDAEVLGRALEQLVVHHDALRLRFEKTEQGWCQVIATLDEAVRDGCSLRQFELAELRGKSASLQASLNLQHGPLMRVALFTGGADERNLLLIVIHHLAVDGVSWGILLEDLQTLYTQLSRGKKIELPPKTTSFKAWSEQLSKHAASNALLAEAPYWAELDKSRVSALPVDYENGANTAASANTVTVSLDARETLALLMEAPAAYRTQINEVLLTALAQTLSQWTNSSSVLIDLEGHGREEIFSELDLSRTVGWFTTIFPVVLDLQESGGVINSLRIVKEQLRAVPNRGLGYGLLRYLSGNQEIAEVLGRQPQAEIRFNYLGQTDRAFPSASLFEPASESSGPAQSAAAQRGYLINIIGAVTGGALRLEWTYSENIHRRETIERLAASYLEELRTLITNSRSADAKSLSPTDFPQANLSRKDLDKVLSRLRRT